jgi:spore maturation protein CgeB
VSGLDVLVLGESDPAGLTGSYARGFESLGLSVEVADYYGVRDGGIPRWLPGVGHRLASAIRRPRAEGWIVQRVRERRPRLIFMVKCDDLTGQLYGELRAVSPGARLSAFHPDDPFNTRGLFRRGPSHARAIAQLRSVDDYFIWAPRLVTAATKAGARHARYLAFGFDQSLHGPVESSAGELQRFRADVSFVGNWDAKREAWLSAFEGAGLDLAVWGSEYWRDRCTSRYLRSCWRGGNVTGPAFCRAITGAKVCVNILRPQNDGGHNMRTFEVPGCGGMLLAEWNDDQARHFVPDREAVYARSPADLVALARRYCEDSRSRETIRLAGYQQALRNTYAARAREVWDVLVDSAAPRPTEPGFAPTAEGTKEGS